MWLCEVYESELWKYKKTNTKNLQGSINNLRPQVLMTNALITKIKITTRTIQWLLQLENLKEKEFQQNPNTPEK